MRIHHSHPDARFTIIPNATLQDQRLSTTARGVLVDLLSRPDGWQANADRMVEQAHRTRPEHAEGRRMMRSAYAELEALGYLVRSKVRQSDGTIRTEFDVYDTSAEHRGTASGTSAATSDDAHSPSLHRGTAYRTSVGGTSLERPSTENEEHKDPPVRAIASLSPPVAREPAQAERDEIFVLLAKEHGVSAQRLAQVAREHGATPEEFAGAWRIASDPYYADQEYRKSFRDYLGAWIKVPAEVREDLESYRDKRDCDAQDAAARAAWQPLGECVRCKDPLPRGTPAGTVCSNCREELAA